MRHGSGHDLQRPITHQVNAHGRHVDRAEPHGEAWLHLAAVGDGEEQTLRRAEEGGEMTHALHVGGGGRAVAPGLARGSVCAEALRGRVAERAYENVGPQHAVAGEVVGSNAACEVSGCEMV